MTLRTFSHAFEVSVVTGTLALPFPAFLAALLALGIFDDGLGKFVEAVKVEHPIGLALSETSIQKLGFYLLMTRRTGRVHIVPSSASSGERQNMLQFVFLRDERWDSILWHFSSLSSAYAVWVAWTSDGTREPRPRFAQEPWALSCLHPAPERHRANCGQVVFDLPVRIENVFRVAAVALQDDHFRGDLGVAD